MLKLKNKIKEAENNLIADIDQWHEDIYQAKKFIDDFKYITLIIGAFLFGIKLASKRPFSLPRVAKLFSKKFFMFKRFFG